MTQATMTQASPTEAATTPATIAWPVLRAFLAHDQATGEALLTLLDTERTHLEQRDYAAFEQLLERKGALLVQLEQNSLQRRQWQQSVGWPDDTAALAATRQADPALAEQWGELAALWEECQQRSRVNDQICQRTRLVVGRVLDILSGNAGQGSTYDAGGATHRLQSGRDIASA